MKNQTFMLRRRLNKECENVIAFQLKMNRHPSFAWWTKELEDQLRSSYDIGEQEMRRQQDEMSEQLLQSSLAGLSEKCTKLSKEMKLKYETYE